MRMLLVISFYRILLYGKFIYLGKECVLRGRIEIRLIGGRNANLLFCLLMCCVNIEILGFGNVFLKKGKNEREEERVCRRRW